MKINIAGNNLELTPSIKKYIETHLATLDKFLAKYNEAAVQTDVVIARATKHHSQGDIYTAEIHINIPKKSFMSKADGSDVRAIFDQAKDKISRELSDYKNQRQNKRG